MKQIPLNLAKFKKVQVDDQSTMFEHPDGHQIRVAHTRLKPELREKLDMLPLADMEAIKYAEGTPSVGEQGVSDDVERGPARVESAVDPGSAHPFSQDQPTPVQGPAVMPEKQNPDPYGLMTEYGQQIKGMKEFTAGKKAEAKAVGDQGTQSISQEQEFQKQMQANMATYQQAMQPILKARQDMMNDIANQHIDPQRYIKSMSTGDKILNGIGMALSGMGSGLAHQPNLAFNYLQSQIDRDIASQRDELGKKENLLTHNFQQTHDITEAYNLTKLQTDDLMGSHLRMVADQAADPKAKALALQYSGMFDQNVAQLQHQMAMQKMMLGGMGPGTNPEEQFKTRMQYLRMNGQESMAKDMEAKHLPGQGQSSVELTPENRQEWQQMNNLEKSYKDAQEYLKNVSTFGTGWQNAHKAQGAAIMNQMEIQMGQLVDMKRFTPELAKRYHELVPDLTGFHFTNQDQAKLTQAFAELQNHKQNFLYEHGLGQAQPTSTNNFGFKPMGQ